MLQDCIIKIMILVTVVLSDDNDGLFLFFSGFRLLLPVSKVIVDF